MGIGHDSHVDLFEHPAWLPDAAFGVLGASRGGFLGDGPVVVTGGYVL
jgi:hypothetical protein